MNEVELKTSRLNMPDKEELYEYLKSNIGKSKVPSKRIDDDGMPSQLVTDMPSWLGTSSEFDESMNILEMVQDIRTEEPIEDDEVYRVSIYDYYMILSKKYRKCIWLRKNELNKRSKSVFLNCKKYYNVNVMGKTDVDNLKYTKDFKHKVLTDKIEGIVWRMIGMHNIETVGLVIMLSTFFVLLVLTCIAVNIFGDQFIEFAKEAVKAVETLGR